MRTGRRLAARRRARRADEADIAVAATCGGGWVSGGNDRGGCGERA